MLSQCQNNTLLFAFCLQREKQLWLLAQLVLLCFFFFFSLFALRQEASD